MSRIIQTIRIRSIEQIPSLETIRQIPRQKALKLIFEMPVQAERKRIGEELRRELIGFQVGIHLTEPEINIVKLITDEEVETHQLFFERCAKDYRALAQKLIDELEQELNIVIDKNSPLNSFHSLKTTKRQRGTMGDWNYFLHGFHCGFVHQLTQQTIEVPLTFANEFGGLDPYFFTNFIKSTSAYNPLPVDIIENYGDGQRIIEKMLSLGKFEKIKSNFSNHFGVVVADRERRNEP